MNNNFYAVIMAGGGGTRLWPLSRSNRPKQMLKLGSQRTLFQLACDRLEGVFPPERILVVTVADQADALRMQVPAIPPENYLIEPMPRGTASVVGLAAITLNKRDPQAVMAVLTADHMIENVAYFQKLLNAAFQVSRSGQLVTLGITPSSPSTAYGYIQRETRLESIDDQQVFSVARFKEKPTLEAAKEMLAGQDHDWNSGMFIWRVVDILEEFDRQMPTLAASLQTISDALGTARQDVVMQDLWPKIHPQTIDYGIMEHARRVVVLPAAGLGWNDVGSWDSLFDVLPGDVNGNILLDAKAVSIESRNNLVLSDGTARLVATIGIQDIVVIDTQDVLLICKREDAQKVREAVQRLKDSGENHYL